MPKKVDYTYWAADTENTVPRSDIYEKDYISEDYYVDVWEHTPEEDTGPFTLVWGAGICPVGKDVSDNDVVMFDSTNGKSTIQNMLSHCRYLPGRPVIYFHNFAYDGKFIMTELLNMGYKESKEEYGDPKRGEYKTLITGDGVWYSITVRFAHNSKVVEFRDSLKLLPFSVDAIAKNLKTKAQKMKGSIDYSEERGWFWEITDSEAKYIKNDILVMAEALAMVSEYGLLEKLTIGSSCMNDFMIRFGKGNKKRGKQLFLSYFPVLDPDTDAELRQSYHGAFCYNNTDGNIVVPKDKGYVYDVNSLYPSVMYNHYYPIGMPEVFYGDDFYNYLNTSYIVKGKFWFVVKPNHIPFIQIKHTRYWRDNEYVSDSEGYVEMTFTRPDYELFMEQYDMVMTPEIEKCWVFDSENTLFDVYVAYWYDLKKNAPNPVIRLICKLMLNNLYGKFATSPFKTQAHFELDQFGKLVTKSEDIVGNGVYIPVGAYITAYARCVTVRAAQMNYEHFLYCDTDSLHLDVPAVGINVGKELGDWDNETCWSKARFVRQKTYMELTIEKDGKPCEPFLLVRACGASEAVKERLLYKVTTYETEDGKEVNHKFYPIVKDEDDNITNEKRTFDEVLERFKYGLKEAGKLAKHTVSGGVVLQETFFSIRC